MLFYKTYIVDIVWILNNEEIGRYEFITTNFNGCEIKCIIYMVSGIYHRFISQFLSQLNIKI